MVSILVVARSTCLRVNTCILIEEEVVERATDTSPVRTSLISVRIEFLWFGSRETCELVLVVHEVELSPPAEILILDDVTVNSKFDTGVLHVHLVAPDVVRRTFRTCERALIEEVVSLLYEEVELDVETIPESSLETEVEVLTLLPSEVWVTTERLAETSTCVGTHHVVLVNVSVDKTDVVVTLCTVADFELGLAHPVHVLEPWLFLETPACINSPERTPTVVLGEDGATITTDRCVEVVTVEIVVVATEEICIAGGLVSVAIESLVVVCVGKLRVAPVHESSHRSSEVFHIIFLVLMTKLEVESMVAVSVVPLEELLCVERSGAAVGLVSTSTHCEGVATHRGHEVSSPDVTCVVTNVGEELEVLEEVSLEVSTSGDVVSCDVVDILSSGCIRVGLRRIWAEVLASEVILLLAVLVEPRGSILMIEIDWIDWCETLSEIEEVSVAVGTFITLCIRLCAGVSHATTDLDILTNHLVEFDFSVVTLEVRVLHITLIAEVAERGIDLSDVVTCRHVGGVFLTESVGERLFEPVVTPLVGLGVRVELAGERVDKLIVGHPCKLVVFEVF